MEKDQHLSEFASELTTSDYAFIIDEDGDLKCVMMPPLGMEIPQPVKKIFKLFGIKTPHELEIHSVQ